MWKPESNGNLQALTKINYQSRCPRTIIFRQKLKVLLTRRPALRDILKEMLQIEGKNDLRWKEGHNAARNKEHQKK